MSSLRLESYDGEVLELPDVCMQCGLPATVHKSKKFSWCPQWVWILLFCGGIPVVVILSLILTKRRRVNVPFCEDHKNHWLWRILVTLGGLLVCGAIGVAALAFNDNRGNDNPLGGYLCAATLIGLLAWIIAAAIIQSTSIRPTEITDTSITLAGVSKTFVEAYEEEWSRRPSADRLDELASERWNERTRRPASGRRPVEDSDRVRRPDEDDDRPGPPDAYRE